MSLTGLTMPSGTMYMGTSPLHWLRKGIIRRVISDLSIREGVCGYLDAATVP